MKKSMTVLTVSVLLLAAPARLGLGGQLLRNQVGAGANWVAHLNFDQLVKSQLGQLIRSELAKEGLEEQLQGFQTIFSFHPIDDIRDVTIYGNGSDREKAVALFEGSFDKEKLVAVVRMNPQYKEIKDGDLVVHSWVDENKKDPNGPDQRMYGCTYDNMVVLGAGFEAVKQAVDVLKGTSPNAADGVFKQSALDAEGAFFQVAANAVNDLANHQNEAAVLEQTDELGAAVGENNGTFYVNVSLRAGSEEIAQNVKKVLEGIIAFLTLAGSEHPSLAELAGKLKLSAVDRMVALSFESSSESVFASLKEAWQKEKNKAAQPTPP
ncbi:MAG TPA: hypothetical protein VJJ98_11565 [Sedimentisphaerales bacterium]|nr:hypothetical protein [Sedimentisphaerales bacterium]